MLTRRRFVQSGATAAVLTRFGAAWGAIAGVRAAHVDARALDKGDARMIKVVAPAQHHPRNRTLAQFQNYWAESHGPLFSNTRNLRRYVQHITLTDAYGGDPSPTYDGVSMFWYDQYEPMRPVTSDPEVLELFKAFGASSEGAKPAPPTGPPPDPRDVALFKAVLKDDAQLFDRSTGWPMHNKFASVSAIEHVIVDGPTDPTMVKAIYIASKMPGLTLNEFFDHWRHHHGPLGAKVPGLRRYVQNHAILESYLDGSPTHDGWSELWFDDLAALRRALKTPEWRALGEDGATLFASKMDVGVARERVQKELTWKYNDWGVGAMSLDDVRERLKKQGYAALAADADAPRKIKAAAAAQALAVWTAEHIVTIDDSRIDARPRT